MEFSEIYSHYDKQEEKNLEFRRSLENKISIDYLTFYEKFRAFLKIDPLTLSISFGVFLFSLHLLSSLFEDGMTEYSIIEDFSFFLALMNATGLYLIFSATERFRNFLVNLIQLTKKDDEESANKFLSIYKERFLGKRTLWFGFLFGLVNALFAHFFGVCYSINGQYYLLSTFYIQVFSIGFIGGITVNATTVIVQLINTISIKDDINLTYFYPDKCAGTLIIGNILFTFAIHFILIGIMIFLFIHNFEWTSIGSENPNGYILILIDFWKIFPFLLSGIVFFIPVKKLNILLREYKIFEQLKVRKRMNYLTGMIMGLESDSPKSKEKIEILDNHYQKLLRIDKEIGELNTWPYNLAYRTTFLGIFLPVSIGIILEISKQLISDLFK